MTAEQISRFLAKYENIICDGELSALTLRLYDRFKAERGADVNRFGMAIYRKLNERFSDMGFRLNRVTKEPFGIRIECGNKILHYFVSSDRKIMIHEKGIMMSVKNCKLVAQ